jgi:hypothetical protein
MTRRVVPHPTPAIVLALFAVFVMSGCTTTTPGAASTISRAAHISATPGTTTVTVTDPLSRVDPCALLDPAVIQQNQLQSDKSGTGPGSRYCQWDTGASGVGYNVAINIYDHAGIDQLPTTGFVVTNDPVGNHSGRLSKATAGGACSVSIGVTSTSRVDVVGVDYSGQLDRACVVATTVAPSVAQKLPAGGN